MLNAQLAASSKLWRQPSRYIVIVHARKLTKNKKTERDLTIIHEYTTCSKDILLNFWLTSSTFQNNGVHI